MERLKNITIISLLAVGFLTSTAPAKTVSVLLQEGLYAEEIQGDLDGAIKIYEQVIVESKEIQRAAAQATYRIGMCYLKKGEKAKAAEQFQNLISKYPAQKTLGTRAREQLKTIVPPAVGGFGPVIEQVIFSEENGTNFFFDLDTTKAFSPPTGLTRDTPPIEIIKWGRTKGIDFINDKGRFELAEMVAVEVPGEMWYSAGPAEIRNALSKASSLKSLPTQSTKNSTVSSPITYAFKTREGGIGILQILDKNNNNLRIRYKLLRQKHPEIEALIKEMHGPEKQRFAALNKLIKIGAPAVEPLVSELQKSNNWQVPKALGAIGDKRAIEPLIRKWQKSDWSPMKEVIAEALERITGKKLGQDKQKWDKWWEQKGKPTVELDLSTPEATIKSFVKAVYDGNLEAAGACVSKDGADYDEFKEMLATESNHPFQALIKAMDVSVPVEITSKSIKDGKCKLSWYFTLGRVYYFGETKMNKGTPQEFSSYLELVGDKWLIRDI